VHAEGAPAGVSEYLERRGFDPEWLYANFSVVACEANAEYRSGDAQELRRTWDTRVVIPVYQSGELVGWQGRAIAASKQKYIFPAGCAKTEWLYNKDYAKFRGRILVTEGATNVWAFAAVSPETDSAVATFGKSVSAAQIASMARLWAFHDNVGVLCLDPDAAHLLPETVDAMLAAGCFGGGLSVLLLEDGWDPARMFEAGRGDELRQLFDAACARACKDRPTMISGLERRIASAAAAAAAKAREAASRRTPDVFGM
jgi:hypothetical protein